MLPYAPEDRFAVVICFNQILQTSKIEQTRDWVREASELAIRHGGAPYMAYQSFLTRNQYQRTYDENSIKRFIHIKQRHDAKNVFTTGLHSKYLSQKTINKTNIFLQLKKSQNYRNSFTNFLNRILVRVNADDFFQILDAQKDYLDYEDMYVTIQKNISSAMSGFVGDIQRILKSLREIKEDLIQQAIHFHQPDSKIDGMLEIGYPGRFISQFQKSHSMTGKNYVLVEQESMSDYIQTGFPRPYTKAFKLDYKNPVKAITSFLKNAGESSVEIITCFVGLHHFPVNALNPFMKKVYSALKPSGKFILVDHNIENKQDRLMAELAHSVFNIATGETVENDMRETGTFNVCHIGNGYVKHQLLSLWSARRH